MKMKLWGDVLRPTFVLVLVCVVISGALALTYNLAGVKDLANAGYTKEELVLFASEALPAGDELEKVKLETEIEDFKDLYKAKNGSGYGIVLISKGYSSDGITMMVGFDSAGVVQGISVIAQTETPGIGDKVVANREYLDSFVGATAESVPVDIIAGATKSSNGVINGVKKATELFETLKGEGVIS